MDRRISSSLGNSASTRARQPPAVLLVGTSSEEYRPPIINGGDQNIKLEKRELQTAPSHARFGRPPPPRIPPATLVAFAGSDPACHPGSHRRRCSLHPRDRRRPGSAGAAAPSALVAVAAPDPADAAPHPAASAPFAVLAVASLDSTAVAAPSALVAAAGPISQGFISPGARSWEPALLSA
ncbi:hypothetical protein ABZP36_014186 [Zizania latifolia]